MYSSLLSNALIKNLKQLDLQTIEQYEGVNQTIFM